MTRAFRDAVRDPKVRAILFRIDSPGGSVVASETIWHDVVFARERGKPVVVSMGDVAGSGGYYVAAPADKIVAEPATLTGSIGVLAGKLVVAELLKKIGVSTDAAQFGANAAMFSATSDFSPLARARLQAFLDATYQGFKDHVAAGRHMTPDAVEAVAQGRVWSGEEAKANGLVDALGGYEVALRLAKEVANIPADAPVELTVFPRREGLAAYLYDRLTGKERDDNDIGVTALGRAIEAAQPMVERIEAVLDNSAIVMHAVLRPASIRLSDGPLHPNRGRVRRPLGNRIARLTVSEIGGERRDFRASAALMRRLWGLRGASEMLGTAIFRLVDFCARRAWWVVLAAAVLGRMLRRLRGAALSRSTPTPRRCFRRNLPWAQRAFRLHARPFPQPDVIVVDRCADARRTSSRRRPISRRAGARART